jgi:hypothetical protein
MNVRSGITLEAGRRRLEKSVEVANSPHGNDSVKTQGAGSEGFRKGFYCCTRDLCQLYSSRSLIQRSLIQLSA